MRFCPQCGMQLQNDDVFCPRCGASIGSAQQQADQTSGGGSYTSGSDNASAYQSGYARDAYQGIERPVIDKGLASIIGYLSWLGFLIGMTAGDRRDPYARFHLNRALVMHIVFTCASILFGISTVITAVGAYSSVYSYYYSGGVSAGYVIGVILLILSIAAYIFTFVCWIIALVRACKGTTRPVPLLDKWRILK